MKLTDIISKKSEIQEGIAQFFIAENDFSYHGLPILKNSLIFYDGDNDLRVNMIQFVLFGKSNAPKLVSEYLPKHSDNISRIVERCSDCEFEIDKLGIAWRGIWHQDHFDKWSGDFSIFLDRIEKIPTLEFSGITFSSLMYNYSPHTNTLSYFINTKPLNISINNRSIEFPAFVEISLNKSGCSFFPLKDFYYFGIPFYGYTTFSENGTLNGSCSNDITVEILEYRNWEKLYIRKGKNIEVEYDGKMFTRLYSDKSKESKKCEIRLIKDNQ